MTLILIRNRTYVKAPLLSLLSFPFFQQQPQQQPGTTTWNNLTIQSPELFSTHPPARLIISIDHMRALALEISTIQPSVSRFVF